MGRVIAQVKETAPPSAPRLLRLRLAVRWATVPIRGLPDFLIIGAQKAGTTSLYQYLSQHPLVIPSLGKEIYYFSFAFGRGLTWYRVRFPSIPRKAIKGWIGGGRALSFEATPEYLLHPLVPSRVAEAIPGARFVVLLRNPADRAFSHYQHTARHGHERLSFEDAIAREEERLAPELEALERDPLHDCRAFFRFSYTTRGFYVEQLRRWMEYFPRERFLIEESEEFFTDPAKGYQRVVDFLGLPHWELGSYANYSPYPDGVKPTGDRLKPETREFLMQLFRPHNERLYEFLGRRFSWDG